MEKNNDAEVVARLILSTKRKKRNLSIVEIASDINKLKNSLGGINEVSKVIGISSGMLNKFLSVFNLPSDIQVLVQQRKIDSVAIVHLLSKFTANDIEQLSKKIVDGSLNSQTLKILLPYRNQHKEDDITDLLEKIESSKDIQVSVIRFPKELVKKSVQEISDIIKSIVSEDNFISVIETQRLIDIKVKKQGEKILRLKAKEKRMSLSELVATLIK